MGERAGRTSDRHHGGFGLVPLLAVIAVGAASAVAVLAAGSSGETGGQTNVAAALPVRIEAFPRWGPSPPGSWTPYVVSLRNDGVSDVEGDLLLVPNAGAASAEWPTYRSPLTLAGRGGEKTVTTL
ncbi:MAG TPA: hypothetical protein VK988_17265, partial [Acidimicrobiales bacterium]|nr:hypothetical protein [Acidimicrobiales bacterium]